MVRAEGEVEDLHWRNENDDMEAAGVEREALTSSEWLSAEEGEDGQVKGAFEDNSVPRGALFVVSEIQRCGDEA